jgi:excisionase family DNA binding protein
MESKIYLTTKEAAEYIGTTVNYLYKLTSQQHRIPYYSPGGRKTLFKRSELDEWIERSRVATADEIEQKAVMNV